MRKSVQVAFAIILIMLLVDILGLYSGLYGASYTKIERQELFKDTSDPAYWASESSRWGYHPYYSSIDGLALAANTLVYYFKTKYPDDNITWTGKYRAEIPWSSWSYSVNREYAVGVMDIYPVGWVGLTVTILVVVLCVSASWHPLELQCDSCSRKPKQEESSER